MSRQSVSDWSKLGYEYNKCFYILLSTLSAFIPPFYLYFHYLLSPMRFPLSLSNNLLIMKLF